MLFPVGDFLRRRTTPYVNWALIAINVAVFIYTLTLSTVPDELLAGMEISKADLMFFDWGYVPACVTDYFNLTTDANPAVVSELCPVDDREPLQLLTSMFLHGGWAHIAGNMVFLWIFGDNVEDRMGHIPYLAFYLLCGFIASAAQIFVAPDALVPTVGASGAIAAVLAAYFVLHPKATVQVVLLPFFFIPFFVPAVVLIGFWFVMQLFSGFAEIGTQTATSSGVAFWAHIGGFVAGAVLVWLFKQRSDKASRSYYAGP